MEKRVSITKTEVVVVAGMTSSTSLAEVVADKEEVVEVSYLRKMFHQPLRYEKRSGHSRGTSGYLGRFVQRQRFGGNVRFYCETKFW
jgi:hypothetical protein